MKTLLVSEQNDVLTVTLNRPELHNAFNPEMIAELVHTFKSVSKNVRAVLLKAEGKNFCAGADLNWMKSMAALSLAENKKDSEKLFEMFEAISCCPVPVIGRIHGNVFGGGLGLVAVCDIVACVRDTKFCFSEAKLGLVPAVISAFVCKKSQPALTRQMMLTAQVFDEQKSCEMGLVQFVGSDEEVDDYLQSQIDFVLMNGPEAVTSTKQLLEFVSQNSWSEIKNETTRIIAERRVSDEGQSGMKAFFEKRKPSWKK